MCHEQELHVAVSDNTCQENAKPAECATDDNNPIKDKDCQCAAGSTTADCATEKFCWTNRTCQKNAKPTPCAVSDETALEGIIFFTCIWICLYMPTTVKKMFKDHVKLTTVS